MKLAKGILVFLFLTIFISARAQVISTFAGNGTGSNTGDGGQASAATVFYPQGVCVDKHNNIIIAAGFQIRKVDTSGIITTIAGTSTAGFSGDGGPALLAQFNNITGITIDHKGNIYVSDYNNSRVRKIDTSGIVTTIAGTGVNGYNGDGIAGTLAQINHPYELAADTLGNVYIADYVNFVVRRVDSTGIITTFAGTPGVYGYSGDGGPATLAKLQGVCGLEVDASGALLIADDKQHVVRKVNTSGIITTIAGTNVGGFSGDGGLATSAQLNAPDYLSIDKWGNIFVSDFLNYRIRKINPAGIISTYVGNGTSGFSGDGGPATMAKIYVYGTAADQNGNLYLASYNYSRVRMVAYCASPIQVTVNGSSTVCYSDTITLTASGATTYTWSANAGSVTTATAAVHPTTSQTYTVTGVAGACADTTKFLLTPVPKVSINGSNQVCIGNTTVLTAYNANTYTWMPGAITAPTLQAPGNAMGSTVYTVTGDNGTCLSSATFTVTTTPCYIIDTYAGNHTLGYSGDGGAALQAQFNDPEKLTVDTLGNVYVSDYGNNRVRKIDQSGIINSIAGNGVSGFGGDGGQAANAQLWAPKGLAFDHAGNLYIADCNNHRIRKIDPSGIISTIAGTGVGTYAGDGGPAIAASLKYPAEVCVDAAGNIYIADEGNNRIRKINTSGAMSTIAGTGVAGFTGDNGQATLARLSAPSGVTVDAQGNIYISDAGNNRVRKINGSGVITTIAGGGVMPYNDGYNAISDQLYKPTSVCVDTGGVYYIAETNANAVKNVQANNIINTLAGAWGGWGGYIGDGGPARYLAKLYHPTSIAVAKNGDIFVTDAGNNVVRKLHMCTTSAPLTINGIHNLCSGSLVNLTASGASTCTWSPGNLTGTSIAPTPTVNTLYNVTGYNGTCNGSDTFLVKVITNPGFTLSVTGGDTICSNASEVLSASGANSYTWTANAGAVQTTTATVTPINTTTYGVTGQGASCATYTTFVVHVPTVSIIAPTSICWSAIPNSYAISASPAQSYTWSTNAGNSHHDTVTVTPMVNTIYTVTATTHGCVISDTALVKVIGSTISITGNNVLCHGDSTMLTAHGADSYLWSYGASSDTNATFHVKPNATTQVQLNTWVSGCSQSFFYTIYVDTLAFHTHYGAVCPGGSDVLSVQGIANSYNWMPGNLTNDTVTVFPSTSTVYTVTANGNGCVLTNTISVNVINCASLGNCSNMGFENDNFSNWTGSFGTNTLSTQPLYPVLSVIDSIGFNLPVSSYAPHTLVTPGGPVDPYGNFAPVSAGGGIFAVRMGGDIVNTQMQGETLQQTFTVSAQKPIVDYRIAVVLNDGGHGPGEQAYFRAEVLDSAGNVLPCLTYSVEAINMGLPPGFVPAPSSISASVSYLPWTTRTFDLRKYVGRTVTMRFTTAGCIYSAHFGYAYIDCSCDSALIKSIGTLACSNQQTTLYGPPGFASYNWYGSGVMGAANGQNAQVGGPGTYSVITTDYFGCKDTTVLNLTAAANSPTVSVIASADTICIGQNTLLSAGGANNYQWSPNAGSLTTNTVNVFPSATTTYYVIGTSTLTSCSDTATINITVLTCAGIDNKETSFSIYPNPAETYLIIKTTGTSGPIIIYNIYGEKVYENVLQSSETSINVSQLRPGPYFILVAGKRTKFVKE